MGDVIDKLGEGLANAGLMAYEVWWALVLGFAISAIVQSWVPRQRIEATLSGEGGHDRTFQAACLLVRDFALDPEDAWPLLVEYSQRCQPPWSEAELMHKLLDADHFDGMRGCKLVEAPVSGNGEPLVKPALAVSSHGIGVRTGSRPRPRPGSRSSRGSCTWSAGISTRPMPSSSP